MLILVLLRISLEFYVAATKSQYSTRYQHELYKIKGVKLLQEAGERHLIDWLADDKNFTVYCFDFWGHWIQRDSSCRR